MEACKSVEIISILRDVKSNEMTVQNEKYSNTYWGRAANFDELMISRRRSDRYLISLPTLSSACHGGGQSWPPNSLSPPRPTPVTGLSRPRCSRSSHRRCRPLILNSASTGQRPHEISLNELGVVALVSEEVRVLADCIVHHLLHGVPLGSPRVGGRWPRDYLLQ